MFNVTVLRMKDVTKFFIGITFVLLIIYLGKFLYKEKDENTIAKGLADGVKILTSNSMTQSLDQTIISVSAVNNKNETSLLYSENDENIKQSNILENILETQISSLKIMEAIEKNEEIEMASSTNQLDSQNNSNEEKIELARNRITNTSYY